MRAKCKKQTFNVEVAPLVTRNFANNSPRQTSSQEHPAPPQNHHISPQQCLTKQLEPRIRQHRSSLLSKRCRGARTRPRGSVFIRRREWEQPSLLTRPGPTYGSLAQEFNKTFPACWGRVGRSGPKGQRGRRSADNSGCNEGRTNEGLGLAQ